MRPSRSPSPQVTIVPTPPVAAAASRSSDTRRWSQSAKAGLPLAMIAESSGTRSIGIVVTAIAPVFMTASQAAYNMAPL